MAAMISQGRALVEHANQPVTVLLVDQHAMVREGLSRILAAEASIAVVGSVGEGPEALALAVRLRPDVVILDADLPDVTGLIVHLTADVPTVGVLLLPTTEAMHVALEHGLVSLSESLSLPEYQQDY